MRRVAIIVEGKSELAFVKELLAPYIYSRVGADCLVEPILIHMGRGGFSNYEHLRNDAVGLLSSKQSDLIVTMFVDYFRIPQSRMPEYEVWKDEENHYRQAEMMEEAMARDIDDRRFVPYIQMHEFEALLFSSMRGFEMYWKTKDVEKIRAIKESFANPEDINTSPQGAPSKRILSINPRYAKPVDGNVMAIEIGIETMLEACPKFRKWVETIVSRLERQ